jgi:hypothetical protein
MPNLARYHGSHLAGCVLTVVELKCQILHRLRFPSESRGGCRHPIRRIRLECIAIPWDATKVINRQQNRTDFRIDHSSLDEL